MSQAKFIQHPNGELALAVYDPVLGQMKEVSPDCLSFELGRLLAGSSSHSSPPSLEPNPTASSSISPPFLPTPTLPSVPITSKSGEVEGESVLLGGQTEPATESAGGRKGKWKRTPMACLLCRDKRKKCGGPGPNGRCQRCTKRGLDCTFEPIQQSSQTERVGPSRGVQSGDRVKPLRPRPYTTSKPTSSTTQPATVPQVAPPTLLGLAPIAHPDSAIRLAEERSWAWMMSVLDGDLVLDQ